MDPDPSARPPDDPPVDPAAQRVEVVDADGAVVDLVDRATMRAGNLRHRSTYIVVHRASGPPAVLAHQRAPWKDVWPHRWDVAFGGVLGPGEAWVDGARRELHEEAGIDVAAAALTELGPLTFDSPEVRVVGRVYATAHDGPFAFPDGEVVDSRWIELADLVAWLAELDPPLCPDSAAGVVPHLRPR